MKVLTMLLVLVLSACSVQTIDMAPEPTQQQFDAATRRHREQNKL